MTPAELRATLADPEPPPGLGLAVEALWWDARKDWGRAHGLAMEDPSPDGAAVHAYLHREEGDLGNAAYWYSRAGRPVAQGPLEAEWEALVADMMPPAG